ncbi:MAG: hypothetical protein IT160_15230 [Bryobacterales bacterium]|nr:hypothetical protein [Bryobacterales bacterium]
MARSGLPLWNHPAGERLAFTPGALIGAGRREHALSREPMPPVCVLDFDGGLQTGR